MRKRWAIDPAPRSRVTRLSCLLALVVLLATSPSGSASSSSQPVPMDMQAVQPTILTLSADSTHAAVDTVVFFRIALQAGASGSVSLFDNAALLATVPVDASGNAAVAVATLSAGAHILRATYPGDASYTPATSPPLNVLVSARAAPFELQASSSSVAVGEPVTLTTVDLPSNATGSVTFLDDGVPIASATLTGISAARYQAFGDEITVGDPLADPATFYVNQVAASANLTSTNFAASGAAACDVLSQQILSANAGPTEDNSPLYSVMIGTNDLHHRAGSYEPVFQTCHQAALAWLGVPREFKVMAGDPGAQVLSGAWSFQRKVFDRTYRTFYTVGGGGALRFSVTTSGRPLYLFYLLGDATPGTFTLTVDGVSDGTVYNTQPSAPTGTASGAGFALVRLPVASGTHILDVIVQSGTAGILAVATPPSPGASSVHPTVLVADVPSLRSTDAPYSSSVVTQYSQDIESDLTVLQGDGLDLRFVATHPSMQGDPSEMADPMHPNPMGQTHLAAAFLNVLGNTSPAPAAFLLDTPPSTVVSFARAGVHAVSAIYSGDSQNAATSAPLISITVAEKSSSSSLALSAQAILERDAVTLQAAVQPSDATGFVDLLDGTRVVAHLPLDGGAASFTTSDFAVGTHALSASYGGDAIHAASKSASSSLQVNPVSLTVSLDELAPTLPVGSPVVLRAVVLPSSATGNITFLDAVAGTLGQATLISGVATLTLNALPAGSYLITASYLNAGSQTASVSNAVTTKIVAAPTTLTLVANSASVPAGTAAGLLASISSAAATGLITFSDNATILGTALLLNGTAAFKTPPLSAGAHSFIATYPGDAANASATSSATLVNAHTSSTSTTLTLAQANIPAGLVIIANVRVLAASSVPPTGTVVLRNGNTVVASAPLSSAADGAGYATVGLDSSTYGLQSLSLIASYTGSDYDAVSESATVVANIIPTPTSESFSLSLTQIPVNSSVTLLAAMQVPGATLVPTGSVTFARNNVSFSTVALDATGRARTTADPLGIGVYSFTATYTPSGTFAPAPAAPPQILRVTPPLALAFDPPTINMLIGSSQTAGFALTSLSGFSGAIASECRTSVTFLTCVVDAPASLQGMTPAHGAVHLTVGTYTSLLRSTSSPEGSWLAIAPALLLPFFCRGRDRAPRRLACVLASIFLASFAGGCGTGGNFGQVPPGAQTVTVSTTAGGFTVSADLIVTVVR